MTDKPSSAESEHELAEAIYSVQNWTDARWLAKKIWPSLQPATPVEAARARDSRLPLQYEDGPDYCTVRDAQGKDFALTMQPDLMKAMEAALSGDVAQPPANPWRDDFENAPTEMHEYFLVRPKGIHPGRGGLFLPTIVQRIDGEFYATDNEVDPIYFGQNEADDHPLKTTLEWQPLPSNWTCSISSTTRETAGGANEG